MVAPNFTTTKRGPCGDPIAARVYGTKELSWFELMNPTLTDIARIAPIFRRGLSPRRRIFPDAPPADGTLTRPTHLHSFRRRRSSSSFPAWDDAYVNPDGTDRKYSAPAPPDRSRRGARLRRPGPRRRIGPCT